MSRDEVTCPCGVKFIQKSESTLCWYCFRANGLRNYVNDRRLTTEIYHLACLLDVTYRSSNDGGFLLPEAIRLEKNYLSVIEEIQDALSLIDTKLVEIATKSRDLFKRMLNNKSMYPASRVHKSVTIKTTCLNKIIRVEVESNNSALEKVSLTMIVFFEDMKHKIDILHIDATKHDTLHMLEDVVEWVDQCV